MSGTRNDGGFENLDGEEEEDILKGLGGNFGDQSKLGLSGIKHGSDADATLESQDIMAFTQPNTPGSLMMDAVKANISKKLLSDSSIVSQMQGEFSIIKGYGGDIASLFSVTNAHKVKGSDHYAYTVTVITSHIILCLGLRQGRAL
jgi:hypothetical protein